MNEERVLKKMKAKIVERRNCLTSNDPFYSTDCSKNADINCASLARELLGIMKAEELEPYFEHVNNTIYFRDPTQKFGDWIITSTADAFGEKITKTLNQLFTHIKEKS
jgi:hypothetical protein